MLQPVSHALSPTLESQSASPGLLPEARGYYLVYERGFSSTSVRQEIEWAAAAGFNLIVFPVFNNGYTLFPSETARSIGMPAINPLFKKGNALADALAISHDLGLQVWGFARPYNFHPRYSLTGNNKLLRKKREWRTEIHPHFRNSPFRRREAYTACPVNPEYRRYLGDVFSELAMGYPVDGLVLSFNGYGLRGGSLDESPFCFCDACARIFHAETGDTLTARSTDPAGLARVRRWQREKTSQAVLYLRNRIYKSRRGLRLFARSQPQWRWHAEDGGPALYPPYCIDWNDLISRGAVEGMVVDHDGEHGLELFSARLVSDLCELHHEALVLPTVQVWTPDDLGPPLEAIRRYPVSGIIAELADPMGEAEAVEIRENYFAEPAQVPESNPLQSVAHLFRRVQSAHEDNPIVRDLMRDFLRLIGRTEAQGMSFELLETMHANLSGLQDAIRRDRLHGYRVPESTLRDIGLARRLIRLACLDRRA